MASSITDLLNHSGVESGALGLVVVLPLIGTLLACLFLVMSDRPERQRLSGWLTASVTLLAAIISAFQLFPMTLDEGGKTVYTTVWTWFSVGDLNVTFRLMLDRLSGVMLLVVTGIGSLIQFYAVGYMKDDESPARFFAYMSLFIFSMLLLVLGDNLVLMFAGWEGVGLCSYLLIGYWYKDAANAEAGQKAFVVNRIGDAGFLLGIACLLTAAKTVSFSGLASAVPNLPPGVIELAAFLLLIGALGKSAQIPLHVWLPDAMAGPTPVSALIHAATMVTAGVYMVSRMGFLYDSAPVVLSIIGIVGLVTSLLAGAAALSQWDIKKVLAYSTISQLGFMFMALSAKAYNVAMFHVVTHAFFKALLFLSAGAIIVACHHEQDMRHFGGLRKRIPVVFWCYVVGVLAISGFPFFSGFYSKDAILAAAMTTPNGKLLFWGGIASAFLTAVYMTRSLMLTFFGAERGHQKLHHVPEVMIFVLCLLALPSFGFGLLYGEALLSFLGAASHAHGEEFFDHSTLAMIASAVAIAGIGLGAVVFSPGKDGALSHRANLEGIRCFLESGWGFDDLYRRLIVRPLRALSAFVATAVEGGLVQGTARLVGAFALVVGNSFQQAQQGWLRLYLLCVMVSTAVICVIVFLG